MFHDSKHDLFEERAAAFFFFFFLLHLLLGWMELLFSS
jgi:hypothetical protein